MAPAVNDLDKVPEAPGDDPLDDIAPEHYIDALGKKINPQDVYNLLNGAGVIVSHPHHHKQKLTGPGGQWVLNVHPGDAAEAKSILVSHGIHVPVGRLGGIYIDDAAAVTEADDDDINADHYLSKANPPICKCGASLLQPNSVCQEWFFNEDDADGRPDHLYLYGHYNHKWEFEAEPTPGIETPDLDGYMHLAEWEFCANCQQPCWEGLKESEEDVDPQRYVDELEPQPSYQAVADSARSGELARNYSGDDYPYVDFFGWSATGKTNWRITLTHHEPGYWSIVYTFEPGQRGDPMDPADLPLARKSMEAALATIKRVTGITVKAEHYVEESEEPDPEHYLNQLLPVHAVYKNTDEFAHRWRVFRTGDGRFIGDIEQLLGNQKWSWVSLSRHRMQLSAELEEANYDSMEALLQAAAPHVNPPPKSQTLEAVDEPDYDRYVDELPPTFSGLLRQNGFAENNHLVTELSCHVYVSRAIYWNVVLWGYLTEQQGNVVTKVALEIQGDERFIIKTFAVYAGTEKEAVAGLASAMPAILTLFRAAAKVSEKDLDLREFTSAVTTLPEYAAANQAERKANIRASGGVTEGLEDVDDPEAFLAQMPETVESIVRGYGYEQLNNARLDKHYTLAKPLEAGYPTVYKELVSEIIVEHQPDNSILVVLQPALWGNMRWIFNQFPIEHEGDIVNKMREVMPVVEKFFAKAQKLRAKDFPTYRNLIKKMPEWQALMTVSGMPGQARMFYEARQVPKGQTYRVQVGKTYWFEYHCFESDRSSDAVLWYHSHQQAKVLKMEEAGGGGDENERAENGQPAAFQVRFADGYTWTAMEDELFDSREHFNRPDPPLPPEQRQDKGKQIAYGKDHGPVGEAEEMPLDDPEAMLGHMNEPTDLGAVYELLKAKGFQPSAPDALPGYLRIVVRGHPQTVKEFLIQNAVYNGLTMWFDDEYSPFQKSEIRWPSGTGYCHQRPKSADIIEALTDEPGDVDPQHYVDRLSPHVCKQCHTDLTEPESVTQVWRGRGADYELRGRFTYSPRTTFTCEPMALKRSLADLQLAMLKCSRCGGIIVNERSAPRLREADDEDVDPEAYINNLPGQRLRITDGCYVADVTLEQFLKIKAKNMVGPYDQRKQAFPLNAGVIGDHVEIYALDMDRLRWYRDLREADEPGDVDPEHYLDFDWEDFLRRHGFKYQEMGTRGWERTFGDLQLNVGISTTPLTLVAWHYRRTSGDRWQLDHHDLVPQQQLPSYLRGILGRRFSA